jgi:hypothetical protein
MVIEQTEKISFRRLDHIKFDSKFSKMCKIMDYNKFFKI